MRVYYSSFLSGAPRRPVRGHPDDAGWDLFVSQTVIVPPRGAVNVPTSIAIAMPSDYCAIIRTRSSTFRRHRLIVSEGVIDAGYRGELFFEVINPDDEEKKIEEGWRLAQLLFIPVPQVEWVFLHTLPDTRRGNDGFGSTGV